jgi:SAM-dependent methyltransferase
MAIEWMGRARQGRVVEGGSGDDVRVDVPGEAVIEARPSPGMAKRGICPAIGNTVLLRPMDDGTWQAVRRFRFEGEREAPLIIPTVDPDVEYLYEPGAHLWLHPYKPFMYDWYDLFDRDLPMLRRLASEAGGPILELACGTGRILFDLARAGHEVTGVDFSRHMLERGAEKLADEPEEVRRRVEFVHGDMSTWSDARRFPLAMIACNSLHYMGSTHDMGSTTDAAPNEQRRGAIRTLFAHLASGGLGVLSNVAPMKRRPRTDVRPAPYLTLCQAGLNPHTNRWTAEYMGLWSDGDTGQAYDGPWRFVEDLPDGTKRTIEFDTPPDGAGQLRVPDRPAPLTRDETTAMMADAGFRDIEIRSTKDLGPVGDDERVVLFLGRRV